MKKRATLGQVRKLGLPPQLQLPRRLQFNQIQVDIILTRSAMSLSSNSTALEEGKTKELAADSLTGVAKSQQSSFRNETTSSIRAGTQV